MERDPIREYKKGRLLRPFLYSLTSTVCQALDINTVPPCSHAEHVGLVSGHSHCLHDISLVFLSTYPVRGTTAKHRLNKRRWDISIHVPRAGYDGGFKSLLPRQTKFLSTYPVRGTTLSGMAGSRSRHHFYPRTPCGVRHEQPAPAGCIIVFLSTYPVRGTTRLTKIS